MKREKMPLMKKLKLILLFNPVVEWSNYETFLSVHRY
jgi:hypothetical protein